MIPRASAALRLAAAVFVMAATVLLPARASVAGPLGDFNAMVFGDFTAPSSDVEGRLYAQGNVSLGSYSVGDKLTAPLAGGDTLVVGGDLSFSSGAVYHGNVKVGGSAAGVASNVRWGLINGGYSLSDGLGLAGLPVDFAAERTRLDAFGAGLAGLADTGTSEYKWTQMFLTGDGMTDRQVFTVDAGLLGAATNLLMSGVADGTEVVINVTGNSASLSGGIDSFFERNRENVIFNFIDAETLNIGNVGVQGSILALDADITTGWGVIWGQVAAQSWNGPTQINQVYYDGTPPDPSIEGDVVGVSEPAMAALLALGYGAAIRLRRRG